MSSRSGGGGGGGGGGVVEVVFTVVQMILAYIQGRVCSHLKLGTRVGSLRAVNTSIASED